MRPHTSDAEHIMKNRKVRAVAIIIHDAQILLMRRIQKGKEYYTFPGGGVEAGETPEQAVKREVMEETSIAVVVDKLLYRHDLINENEHQFYKCQYLHGDPELGGEELEETYNGDIHDPKWVPLSELQGLTLYPLEVRDWVIEDAYCDFDKPVRELQIRPQDLRID